MHGPSWLDGTEATLRPPTKLTLSQWADKYYRLVGSSADAGEWTTRPYQRGIMDAITDPDVERVSVIKSARIGWTEMMNAAIAFFMERDPCPILAVQPTVETAEVYSREMIAPMLRDIPVLAKLFAGAAVKTSGRTLLHKTFPGGVLSLVGANSGAGFAMINRRVVAFDEVDRYPPSAGDEGDPIALGEKRSETFTNRKIIAGSTPLVAGTSRIEQMFDAGDRQRRYWPCPRCGHFDFLAFDPKAMQGHVLRWPDGRPHDASFVCRGCARSIDESRKVDMDEDGEWRAEEEFFGHASFKIWSAYSTNHNASWGKIATEFRAANKLGDEKLRAFVNTTLGETWKERGEAPDWERLQHRREPYKIGTVPDSSIVALTCGVDVQRDRFVYEVVGWAPSRESWSIDYGELPGDTSLESGEPGSPWTLLDDLLGRTFPGPDGAEHTIAMLAIDSGAFTQAVYDWARRQLSSRVIAIKGDDGPRPIIGTASPVDVNFRGKRLQRGYRVFVVGVDTIKGELFGWLGMPRGDGAPPAGWCHFPEYDAEYFKQLTAEQLVTVTNRKTHRMTRKWCGLPNRENHALDCRVYARAAAARLGIDRMPRPAPRPGAPGAAPAPARPAAAPRAQQTETGVAPASSSRSGFWSGGRPRGGWLGRRR